MRVKIIASLHVSAACILAIGCQPTLSAPLEQSAKPRQAPSEVKLRGSRENESAGTTTTQTSSSLFHVVDTRGETLGGYHLIPAGDVAFIADEKTIAYQLVGDEVRHEASFNAGLPQEEWFSIREASGRWPESFWLSAVESGASAFEDGTRLWRWSKKGWAKQQDLFCGEGHFDGPIQPWSNGRHVKLLQCLGGVTSRFKILDSSPAQEGDALLSEPTQITVEKFLGFSTGQLFLAGYRSEYFFELPVVERINAEQGTSRVDLLPGPITPGAKWRVSALASRAADDVYVVYAEVSTKRTPGKTKPLPHFAHFDGSTWKALPAPPLPNGIRDFWVQNDGVQFAIDRAEKTYGGWLVDSNGLWIRETSGRWSPVQLPAEIVADSVATNIVSFWPRAPGDAWAIVEVTHRNFRANYLLHTRPTDWKSTPP